MEINYNNLSRDSVRLLVKDIGISKTAKLCKKAYGTILKVADNYRYMKRKNLSQKTPHALVTEIIKLKKKHKNLSAKAIKIKLNIKLSEKTILKIIKDNLKTNNTNNKFEVSGYFKKLPDGLFAFIINEHEFGFTSVDFFSEISRFHAESAVKLVIGMFEKYDSCFTKKHKIIINLSSVYTKNQDFVTWLNKKDILIKTNITKKNIPAFPFNQSDNSIIKYIFSSWLHNIRILFDNISTGNRKLLLCYSFLKTAHKNKFYEKKNYYSNKCSSGYFCILNNLIDNITDIIHEIPENEYKILEMFLTDFIPEGIGETIIKKTLNLIYKRYLLLEEPVKGAVVFRAYIKKHDISLKLKQIFLNYSVLLVFSGKLDDACKILYKLSQLKNIHTELDHRIYLDLSYCYFIQQNDKQSYKYLRKTIDYCQKHDLKLYLYGCYFINYTFFEPDYNYSVKFFEALEKIPKPENDISWYLSFNIGCLYITNIYLENFEDKKIFQLIQNYKNKQNRNFTGSVVLMILGKYYYETGLFNKALELFLELIIKVKKTNILRKNVIMIEKLIAKCYWRSGFTKTSLRYFKACINVAMKNNRIYSLISIYKTLSKYYEEKSRIKKSSETYIKLLIYAGKVKDKNTIFLCRFKLIYHELFSSGFCVSDNSYKKIKRKYTYYLTKYINCSLLKERILKDYYMLKFLFRSLDLNLSTQYKNSIKKQAGKLIRNSLELIEFHSNRVKRYFFQEIKHEILSISKNIKDK